MIQQTLVVFKPDAVARGLVGEIITRFEKAGFHIAAMKMIKPDSEFLFHHYETIGKVQTRRGEETLKKVINSMTATPVIAIVLEGIEAIDYVRKMVGSTEPKSALPGTIRADYAHMSFGYADANDVGLPNLVHASANLEEAQEEIRHWFANNEIHSYKPAHHSYTR